MPPIDVHGRSISNVNADKPPSTTLGKPGRIRNNRQVRHRGGGGAELFSVHKSQPKGRGRSRMACHPPVEQSGTRCIVQEPPKGSVVWPTFIVCKRSASPNLPFILSARFARHRPSADYPACANLWEPFHETIALERNTGERIGTTFNLKLTLLHPNHRGSNGNLLTSQSFALFATDLKKSSSSLL